MHPEIIYTSGDFVQAFLLFPMQLNLLSSCVSAGRTAMVLLQISVNMALRHFGHQFYNVQKHTSFLTLKFCRIDPMFTFKKIIHKEIKSNTLQCRIKGIMEIAEAGNQTIQLSLLHLVSLLWKVQMDCLGHGRLMESGMSFVCSKSEKHGLHEKAPEQQNSG